MGNSKLWLLFALFSTLLCLPSWADESLEPKPMMNSAQLETTLKRFPNFDESWLTSARSLRSRIIEIKAERRTRDTGTPLPISTGSGFVVGQPSEDRLVVIASTHVVKGCLGSSPRYECTLSYSFNDNNQNLAGAFPSNGELRPTTAWLEALDVAVLAFESQATNPEIVSTMVESYTFPSIREILNTFPQMVDKGFLLCEGDEGERVYSQVNFCSPTGTAECTYPSADLRADARIRASGGDIRVGCSGGLMVDILGNPLAIVTHFESITEVVVGTNMLAIARFFDDEAYQTKSLQVWNDISLRANPRVSENPHYLYAPLTKISDEVLELTSTGCVGNCSDIPEEPEEEIEVIIYGTPEEYETSLGSGVGYPMTLESGESNLSSHRIFFYGLRRSGPRYFSASVLVFGVTDSDEVQYFGDIRFETEDRRFIGTYVKVTLELLRLNPLTKEIALNRLGNEAATFVGVSFEGEL